MNDDQPTQPLTDAELARIREHLASDNVALHDAWLADDALHLLAEVDRLRVALTALGRNERAAANRSLELQEENARLRKQVDDYHESADAHVAKFERQHERLVEASEHVTAARELHEPAQSSAWNYRYCASGCGAGPLQGPDPWPCNTAKALGMGQTGEVRADA